MRRYENGELVGEPDPPPTTTLTQWLQQDLREVQRMIAKNIRIGRTVENPPLVGRAAMAEETLYEIERRA